ncbi:hypothetical protein JCM9492_11310 [Aquifex pyrophilus]
MELTELVNKLDEIIRNEPPDVAVSKILGLPYNRSLLITAMAYLLVIYANKEEKPRRGFPWKKD